MDQPSVTPATPELTGNAVAAADPGSEVTVPAKKASRVARLVAKFGVYGFLFFLIKGLLWLAVPALVIAWRGS